jgi:esterase/lipase superfamily enzyme
MIIFVISLLLLIGSIGYSNVHTARAETTTPAYEITTRGNLDKTQGVNGSADHNKYQLSVINQLKSSCPPEVAIIVHGWDLTESQARERFARVKMSLESNNYSIPVVGFSWDSNTEWITVLNILQSGTGQGLQILSSIS